MLVMALCFRAVFPSVRSFVRTDILFPRYLMNGLSSLDETYREYSLAPTDDHVRFWKSKVKVIAGHRGGEGIHVDAGASKSIFYFFLLQIYCITFRLDGVTLHYTK